MTNDSSSIIADIIRREGSVFTDIPGDIGGPTKFGITLNTLKQVEPNATVQMLRDLTIDQADSIYRVLYVTPFLGTPEPFLGLIVDSAVQHGVSRVKSWLALHGDYASFLAQRIQFYGAIVVKDPLELKFLNGWLSRVTQFIR